MDSKAQLTVDTTIRVAEGKIDTLNAAKLLNKSRRTIERYLQGHRKIGIQFVVHQNTGNSAHNKTCGKTKRKVQALIKNKYFIECSFDTFQDRLVSELRLKGIKKISTANR